MEVVPTPHKASNFNSLNFSERGSWKTQRPDPSTKLSYANRTTFAFALTAIMTVFVLIAVLSVVWEGQFKKYTHSNMEQLAYIAAGTLAQDYKQIGHWSEESFKKACTVAGYSSDVCIQVLDTKGKVIYDDSILTKVNPQTRAELSSIKRRKVLSPQVADSLVDVPITTTDHKKLGLVRVWAFGSDSLLTKADAAFRVNSYGAIWIAAAIATTLACAMGVFVSRSLTRPIRRITSTADAIRNGDLTARTNLVGDDELGKLGETFDGMANSLEKDIKMERRLTSDVAHELRTPLMAMQVTIEAMQDGIYPCDSEHLGIVADETRRLTRLVNTMLQLSRMENGTQKINAQEVDVIGMCRSIVIAQERLFEEKDLRLRFANNTNSTELYACIDRDMIQQAIINLMSNAMRYTPEGGWVVLSIDQDKNDVLITVEDTGIGIAKEEISKVFSRFWRSDASRVRESGGLGVGLSVTKEIIEKHHGFISIDSELNKGTSFTLHIPKEYKQ